MLWSASGGHGWCCERRSGWFRVAPRGARGFELNGMVCDRPAKLDPARVPGRRRRPNTNPIEAFQEFSRQWSGAALYGLKPGGHLAAFAVPRTAHRAGVRSRRSRVRAPRRSHVDPAPGLPRHPRTPRRVGHRPEASVRANHPRPHRALVRARHYPRSPVMSVRSLPVPSPSRDRRFYEPTSPTS